MRIRKLACALIIAGSLVAAPAANAGLLTGLGQTVRALGVPPLPVVSQVMATLTPVTAGTLVGCANTADQTKCGVLAGPVFCGDSAARDIHSTYSFDGCSSAGGAPIGCTHAVLGGGGGVSDSIVCGVGTTAYFSTEDQSTQIGSQHIDSVVAGPVSYVEQSGSVPLGTPGNAQIQTLTIGTLKYRCVNNVCALATS
jgi:hypothetical protein